MGTERLLFVINDLHTFHSLVNETLIPRLCSLVQVPEDTDEKAQLAAREKVRALFEQIMSRSAHLINKAIFCISGRLMARLKENMRSGFSQLPQKLRVTTPQFQRDPDTRRESHLPVPSKDFLDLIYKPLVSLTQHKYFEMKLNEESKLKVITEILSTSKAELRAILREVLASEQKKQSSLLKFAAKRNPVSPVDVAHGDETNWEDLDQMMRLKVQIYVDLTYLKA